MKNKNKNTNFTYIIKIYKLIMYTNILLNHKLNRPKTITTSVTQLNIKGKKMK